MRALACGILSVFFIALPAAAADVYRWVDEKGTVHYSNEAPPKGVKSSKVDIDAEPRAPVTEGAECYTVRCQGERLAERLPRRRAARPGEGGRGGLPGARRGRAAGGAPGAPGAERGARGRRARRRHAAA